MGLTDRLPCRNFSLKNILMRNILILAMILSCFGSCRLSPKEEKGITAHIEIFDTGEKYDSEWYRFLKISLTNHSETTDYYFPYFPSNLFFDNPSVEEEMKDTHFPTVNDYLSHAVYFWDIISISDFEHEYGEDFIRNEWMQYRILPEYDSLNKVVFDEYMSRIHIVSRNPHILDSIIRMDPIGGNVFIRAGETVSMLVNINTLYPPTGTVITYNDSLPRVGKIDYKEYLYHINDSNVFRPYELYDLSDSLNVEWDGKVIFPQGYPPFFQRLFASYIHLKAIYMHFSPFHQVLR